MWLLWIDLGIVIGLFLAALLTMAKEEDERYRGGERGARGQG